MTALSPLAWTAWPLRRKPRRGAFAFAFVVATVALVGAASDGWALPVLACVVLGFSLAPFFFPTRYAMDAQGVAVTRWGRTSRRPWSAFARANADEEVCLLSPYPRRHPLDGIRGVTLLLEGNRAGVQAYAEAMVGRAVGSGDARPAGERR